LNSTIQTKSDAGAYNGDKGITGVANLQGGNGFDAKNYDITYDTTYAIGKKKATVDLSGSRTYGEGNGTAIGDYTVSSSVANGLVDEADTTKFNDFVTAHKGSAMANTANAKTSVNRDAEGKVIAYTDKDSKGITLTLDKTVTDAAQADSTLKNYDLTYTSAYTINPRDLNVTVSGSQT
jgi:hypothetical protein